MGDDLRDDDPWPTWVAVTLVAVGLFYVLLGATAPLWFIPMMELDRRPGDPTMPDSFNTAFVAVMLVMSCGFGLLNFLGAWGVHRRTKWGWIIGICLGGLYAPSICLPFGVVVLYGLLNERTRKRMLGS